jgi:hypothetical protein
LGLYANEKNAREMRSMRTASYTCLDYKRNLHMIREFGTQPVMELITELTGKTAFVKKLQTP